MATWKCECGFAKEGRCKPQKCEKCGELTAENMIRLEEGLKLCLDCYKPYRKFY